MKIYWFVILLGMLGLNSCETKLGGNTTPIEYACDVVFVDEADNDLVEGLQYGGQPDHRGLYEAWARVYSFNSSTKDAMVDPIMINRDEHPMILHLSSTFVLKWEDVDNPREVSYTLKYPKLFGDEAEHALTTYHENQSCFQIVLDGQTYQPDSAGVFRIVWNGARKGFASIAK